MQCVSGTARVTQCPPHLRLNTAIHRPHSRIRAVPAFPRILEELPIRRFSARGDHVGVFDLTSKELTRLLAPTAGTTPELLTGTSLLFAVISIAVALEFLQRSFHSVAESPHSGEFQNLSKRAHTQSAQEARSSSTAHQERLLCRQVINYEKFRGLRWLAIVSALVVWSTGVLNKDNPLQP